MKKALITGNLGFIGSNLEKELRSLKWEVDGIDLKAGQDIRTYEFEGKYDVIFHLAARASIPASFEDPVNIHYNNVYGALRVIEFARKIGARFVFSSSSSVYGEPKGIPTHETDALDYVSPYAFQKREVEEYLRLLNIDSFALRYFNVFGEGQEKANEGDNSLALATFLQQKKEGKPLTIVGTGNQRRDFVYVGDVVRANIMAAMCDRMDVFRILNVGSGKNYSINEIAEAIDPGGVREYLPARPEPQVGLAQIGRIKQVLDWEPKVNVIDWIKRQKI